MRRKLELSDAVRLNLEKMGKLLSGVSLDESEFLYTALTGCGDYCRHSCSYYCEATCSECCYIKGFDHVCSYKSVSPTPDITPG